MGQVTSLSNSVYMDMLTSHVVFICGKRGGGKCLVGDSLITLGNGELVKIKDLEKKDQEIISLNSDLKISPQEKDAFYERIVNQTIKIKLRTGKELELTPEHPLLTVLGWQETKNLTVGSRIATPRIQAVFGDKLLGEHEIKILAYLLAEGHLKNNSILFSNIDEEIVDDFKLAIKQFDPKLRVVEDNKGCFRVTSRKTIGKLLVDGRDKKGQFTSKTRINNKSLIRTWLEKHDVYGKLAKERKMPKAIFTLPKNQLSLFLNRLFSCDGSIYKEGKHFWKISYSSASKEFITSISHLLLRFGIVSLIRKKYSKQFDSYSYELEIKGEFVNDYLQEIGFFGSKAKKSKNAILETIKIKRNPNLDTIPKEIWQSYKPQNWAELGRKIGYKNPKSLRTSINYAPSRQKLLQIALADQNILLENLASSDIFWDEIISIEKIEETKKVYDITVPKTHNFVANDIIVHNSYTMGVIAEGMADLPPEIKQNISVILLDTMGIYWTMKYANMQDKDLLMKWGLDPKPLDVKIFTPSGFFKKYRDEGIPTDYSFSLKASELIATDWSQVFDIEAKDEVTVLIEKVIHNLKELKDEAEEKGENKDFDIDEILKAIDLEEDFEKAIRIAAKNHFINAKNWGIFGSEGIELKKLALPGQITVLDVSCYATQENGWNIKSLIIGLVSQKLFNQRMLERKDEEFKDVESKTRYFSEEENEKQEYPLVWLVIDEAHEFLPNKGKTLATDPLITILREGRQPGISLIMATQQPGKIHTDVMTQSDIILSHRITAKLDTDALSMLMQSYMRTGLDKELDNLPRIKGAALAIDDNNEKMYPIQVRPRFTWHGGSAPTAMHEKKKIFEF